MKKSVSLDSLVKGVWGVRFTPHHLLGTSESPTNKIPHPKNEGKVSDDHVSDLDKDAFMGEASLDSELDSKLTGL